MEKAVAGLVLITITLSGIVSTSAYSDYVKEEKPKIAVINSTIKILLNEIIGDYFEILTILPDGVDPHSFSLTPELVQALSDCELIVLIDPNFFGLEASIISNDQLSNKPYLFSENYSIFGWRYISIPSIQTNFHGSWLDLNNSLSIVKSVVNYLIFKHPSLATYLSQKLALFENLIEHYNSLIRNISKLHDLSKYNVLIAIPGVAYIVNMLGVSIKDVLFTEPGSFPSASRIAEIKQKLDTREYNLIIAPYEMKNKRVGQLVDELSAETGVPVVYIYIFQVGEFSSYLDFIMYDVYKIAFESKVEKGAKGDSVFEEIYLFYFIALLSSIIVIESYVIFRYKRMEFKAFEEA